MMESWVSAPSLGQGKPSKEGNVSPLNFLVNQWVKKNQDSSANSGERNFMKSLSP